MRTSGLGESFLRASAVCACLLAGGFGACGDDDGPASAPQTGSAQASAGAGGKASGGAGKSAGGAGAKASGGAGASASGTPAGVAGSAAGPSSGSAGRGGAGAGGHGTAAAGSGGTAAGGSAAAQDAADAGVEGAAEHFKISVTTTACFGTCPVYEASIDQAGHVEFDGREHVKQMGRASKDVPARNARDVYDALVDLGYWQLRDRYAGQPDGCTAVASDGPTYNWSVQRDGETKSVSHYTGCVGIDALDSLRKAKTLFEEKAELAAFIK